MLNPLYIKALHIIFVVTWFSGLFYIVRLFIYQREAMDKTPEEQKILIPQFKLMARRLWYIIAWPSAALTIITGFILVYAYNYWTSPWMMLKFSLVAALFLYHLYCHKIYNDLQNDVYKWTSMRLRLWNEVATLFLFAIVFLVTFKSLNQWYWGLAALIILGILLMIITKWYKKNRMKD
ncbi:MAG: CopD family protein [Bacteroidia bacterium]